MVTGSISIGMPAGDWLSTHGTLIVGVVGIIVSGVLGPSIATLLSRRNARQQFKRELIVGRREDLTRLLDEAAKLLGVSGSNLRRGREARAAGVGPPSDVEEWERAVFPLGQRLRLHLPAEHSVVAAYEQVREMLTMLAEAGGDEAAYTRTWEQFEQARSRFLEAARVALQAPVDEQMEI
jgi:hypothetical protein